MHEGRPGGGGRSYPIFMDLCEHCVASAAVCEAFLSVDRETGIRPFV